MDREHAATTGSPNHVARCLCGGFGMLVVRDWGWIVFFSPNHSGLGSGAGLADSVAAGRERLIPGWNSFEEIVELVTGTLS